MMIMSCYADLALLQDGMALYYLLRPVKQFVLNILSRD